MPKDLKNMIDNIESSQDSTSRYEEKIERLTELSSRQKKIIADQTLLLQKQKIKLSKMVELPDDIRELREMIGTQRGLLNNRETELEHTKGLLVQAQKELEMTKDRMNPTQIKLDAVLKTMGQLKTEIAQKNSEILVKNETLTTFVNKVKELDIFSKAQQAQLDDLRGGISKKELDILKTEYSEERQKLRTELSKSESQLLDQKLEFQEKIAEAKDMSERYDSLVSKTDELNVKNQDLNEQIKNLNASMEDLRNFKKDNINKITYLDKLKPLMEQDPIFKAFFIIQEVGSMSLDDLKNAIGAPIVIIKRNIQQLEKMELLQLNDDGKISAVKFDEN